MIVTRGNLKFDIYWNQDGFAFEETLDRNLYRIDPKPGMSILDIGAYKGFVSIPAAKAGAYVRCFEPHPDSFATLQRNAYMNDVILDARNEGVWSCGRQSRLLDSPAGNEGGRPMECVGSLQRHIRENFGNSDPTGPIVNLTSFSEALGDKLWDIVKMDCEGSEFEILMKATDAQLRQIDFLTMEVHGFLGAGKIGDMLVRLKRIFEVEGQNEVIYGNLENANFYLRRK